MTAQRIWQSKREDALMIGVIVLAFLIFFGWVIFRQRLFLGGDAFFYSYPLRSVAWATIRSGELPLWTPYLLSGYPLLSMAQLALGYPLTWSYLFLPGYLAEQLYVFAPFLLAPAFTYAYVRSLGRTPLASLLAGLSFGYGGAMTGLLGVVGLFGNSFMWLPLLLMAIDRSRTKKFLPCLLAGTAAFSMSVLNGLAQGFVFVAFIGFAYGACISFLSPSSTHDKLINRLRPLLVVVLSTLFAAGIAAFQILETARAARSSIRSSLTFVTFADGSFSPAVALKSFLIPLYTDRFADVTTFVSPVVFVLALFAFVDAWRRGNSVDTLRIRFWGVLAIVAGLLILGSYTPLARLVFYVPVLNKFRVPSRHAFEFTFALSVLSAFGWDEIKLRLKRSERPKNWLTPVALALLGVTVITSYGWLHATTNSQTMAGVEAVGAWYSGLSVSAYVAWKLVWLTLSLSCLVTALYLRKNLQGAVLIGLVVISCLTEPYILFRNWWSNLAKTPSRVQSPAPVTQALQSGNQDRVYTRFDLFCDDTASSARVDSPNLTALYGLHNLAGYEPLMLERYCRALGNVGLDSVNALPGYPAPDSIYHDNSHVLDILNTSTVATFANLRSSPTPLPEFEGVKFALNETGLEVPPATTKPIGLSNFKADAVVLITSMANSVDIEQGTAVARIRLSTDNGGVIEKILRAGIDTAEWAHERSDVRSIVKHQLAPIFDRQVGDVENSYQAFRYVTRISLENSKEVTRVEFENLAPRATIALWAASLLDSATGETHTLSRLMLGVQNNPQRWRIEALADDVLLLHNSRALPRAWLVTQAEAVDGEEALRRIRGETRQQFDPRHTALLEVASTELPTLPGGVPSNASVRITNYESNRLRMETVASTPTVLVVSEMYYPGWEATVDGKPTRILLTDYLLRGVSLQEGKHVVEMRYTTPAAVYGAIISILSLVAFVSLVGYWQLHKRVTHRSRYGASTVTR